ncbi:MAG: hypothetical protein JSV16_02520 [Candidatus Hydrogenedentota bacterium]|nr:MAG: hypothetical protein JSV16_02520 [Candidatus Hydrogenedentota bacterium]
MAFENDKRAKDERINRAFERQQRRLNRKWFRNAVSGLILVAALLLALQFTPYRNLHRDIIKAAKDLVRGMTSGTAGPTEPDPKYW